MMQNIYTYTGILVVITCQECEKTVIFIQQRCNVLVHSFLHNPGIFNTVNILSKNVFKILNAMSFLYLLQL